MRGPSSYLLCATPRTGSTLLCSLLRSSGVAGSPESWFREPDRPRYAARFGVPAGDGHLDVAAYLAGARRAGSTGNGVFGGRVMWGSLAWVTAGLGADAAPGADVAVLERALGPLRFVHLRRRDVVAQAVSWARADQTGYWQHGDTVDAEPRLDLDQVQRLVATVEEHDAAWGRWFERHDVEPLEVEHEDLVAQPDATTRRVLGWIGVRAPEGWTASAPERRQADATNEHWARRYRESRD